MKQEEYESLIAGIESESILKPSAYRLKLTALATLGYVYVAAVLSLLLGVIGLFVWMGTHGMSGAIAAKLALVIIALVWMVVRAMLVKIEPPSGRVLSREEAPALFDMIERVRLEVRAPKVYQVLVVDDFNAAVVQYSRFGVFGGSRNYLLLGLPLMQALGADEFKAVLAHEFGHLSGAHGKFGAWIYRLRSGWGRLTTALEENAHWGSFLFVPFFKWYAPTFAAYSFVQARRQEYEADRMSAVAAGAGVAGNALVRVALQAQFLQGEYWQRIFRDTHTKERPDAQPFKMMRTAFFEHREPRQSAQTLEQILKRNTNVADTHPCLRDRLRALNAPAAVPGPLQTSAADTFLGAAAAELAAEFDQAWHNNVSDWWQNEHRQVGEARARLAQLDADQSNLSIDDAFARADLTEQLVGPEQAKAQFEALLTRAPDNAAVNFSVGRLKLAQDDDAGIALVETAMRLNPPFAAGACSLIATYLQRHGRNIEARKYLDELVAAEEGAAEAQKERNQLRKTDTLAPHDLPLQTVQEFVAKLAQIPEVRRVYVVRKITRFFPDTPLHVVGFQCRRRWWWNSSLASTPEQLASQLINELSFPADAMALSLDGENRVFRRKFRKVSGGLVYQR